MMPSSDMAQENATHAGPSSSPRRSASPRPSPKSSPRLSASPAPIILDHDMDQSPSAAPREPDRVKAMTAPAPLPTQSSPTTPDTASPTRIAYPQPSQPQDTTPVAGPSTPSRTLLSHHLQQHPDHSVGQAIDTLFPKANPIMRLIKRFKVKHSVISGMTQKEMARWTAEGEALRKKAGWKLQGEPGEGVEVSELFWKMYLSLLPTLERDPLSGLVPPDLLGSTTTMPISIISLIPDIMQHYRDVIIRAEKEVFLATNYWQPSNSVTTISGCLRELSDLVVKQGRPKVVVKIMYDRGSWEQLWNSHAPVDPQKWAPLHLPTKEEVQGLHLEIINFHKVLLGTFHAKFLIVDRKVALLNSNNIQDRPNLELMTHLEGPVVDAFYEIALHSWYNKLDPPLPCMSTPFQPPRDSQGKVHYLFADHNPYFDDIEILKAAKAARLLLRRQTLALDEEKSGREETGRERFRDAVRQAMEKQRQSLADWKPGEDLNARAQTAMHELREFRERWATGMANAMGGASRSASRAGSRSNSRGPSRAPSRRQSATDTTLKAGHFSDHQTAEITARNTAIGAHVDPSEAPSTPTLTSDLPPKSKTMPPAVTDPGSSPLVFPQPDEHLDKPKPHIIFLDTKLANGAAENHAIYDSPVGSAQPSPRPRHKDLPDPILKTPTHSALRMPIGDGGDEDVPDMNGPMPAGVPTNQIGQPLPPTAQIPGNKGPANTIQTESVPLDVVDTPTGERDVPVRPDTLRRTSTDAQPEGTGSRRMFKLSKKFNAAGVLSEAWATVEDSDELDNFRPHVVHAPHDPFPVAMCCRKPHGFPGHHDIRNPQNAAWLAGMRYAKKKIFIQSPTLNARPIVRGVKQACRRGVEVVLLLDLGFNDKGESIPFQGGTNEEVVDRLYKALNKEGKAENLKVYWYTGKDQVRPLNAVVKQRNCHIKFAAYDDQVVILGNGNQDSQSWFHSQEVNIMLDSKQICAEMMDTLISNQNTLQYGLVDWKDGKWKDGAGKTLEDYGLTEKGAFKGLSAVIRIIKEV
ncbi:hypothetical protein BD324DRAFT_630908 [Kockovaella imperatae]|uniref:PLD phosphodiesterase domain-containing protein n=1 Tax=Kockovaella imperatae TaxID=4999 RepID=A0A1Y1UCA6_9TREE|nr:hypothetical protein BD324DRAFT_630908 [Kockovaella imperatae]ORX35632.1 hypothetical protein BD324DRAFT_630908 [Kockovaella imperatae]